MRAQLPAAHPALGGWAGALLPGPRPTPPRVCVVIGMSGSVSDGELGCALLEVAALSRAVGGRRDLVSMVCCDAAAGVAVLLCRAQNLELIGGGTNLTSGRPGTAVRAASGRRGPRHHRPVARS
ncbi:hypothetical protein ABZ686_23955 [Streptomyces sp. NPDC006992]|uniref:hypothetical protein n=1 Tax=Streptomyces sp. NPDC006992 TaxID=3155601 RepID=UPI0033F33710